MLNAQEARDRFEPPYTLEEIERAVEGVCSFSQHYSGLQQHRLSAEVLNALVKLGYGIEVNDVRGTYTINWDAR